MLLSENISLPSTLKTIGENCFAGTDLKVMYYNGTKDEFDAIEIGENWNEE